MGKTNRLNIETATRFAKLVVVDELPALRLPSGQTNRAFTCICDCGTETVVRLLHLVRGRIKSCGCITGERHGMSGTHIYGVWRSMIERCHKEYASENNRRSYQDRGITVCEEWRNSFSAFYAWALANGYEEGLEIDRRENDHGYYPENCRFVTRLANVNNRRVTRMVTVGGEVIPLQDAFRQTGIDPSDFQSIAHRVLRGWSFEDAVAKRAACNNRVEERDDEAKESGNKVSKLAK